MKKHFMKTIIFFFLIGQFNIIGYCQDNGGLKTLFALGWGNGSDEVGIVPKEADDPLAGSGPINFAVDEKYSSIYIYDWANDFRIIQVDLKGKFKNIIDNKKYGGQGVIEFNTNNNGILYILNRFYHIFTFNQSGKILNEITLKNPPHIQELFVDENNNIWTAEYYGGKTYEIRQNGEILATFEKERVGFGRSKGRYFVLKKPQEGKKVPEYLYLCDAKENVLLRLPVSTVLVGSDSQNNCYLSVWDFIKKKQFIWVVNSAGKILKKYEMSFELHDQDSFLQIQVAESGNIYIAPNSDANNPFKIVKINSINK